MSNPIHNPNQFEQSGDEINPISQLLQYYYVFVRPRWWLFLAIPFLFVAAAIVYVQTATSTYQASCRVYLQPEKVKVTNIQDVYDPSGSSPSMRLEFIASQLRLVSSQDVLKKAFATLNLADAPEYQVDNPLRIFSNRLKVSGERGTSFINISYVAKDPKEAANIANGIANAYIDSFRSRQTDVSASGLEKLRGQLEKMRVDRAKARTELTDFKEKNNIVNADASYGLLGTQLSKLNDSLIDAKTSEVELAASLKCIEDNRAEAAIVLPLLTVGKDGTGTGSLGSIKMLALQHQTTLPELLSRYSETHPSVKIHREVGETIDKAMKQEVENGIRSLKMQYDRARQQIALIEKEIAAIQQETFKLDRVTGQYRIFEDTSKTTEDSFRMVISRISELEIAQATGNIAGSIAYVSDAAMPPAGRYSPQKSKICLLALIASLMLAGGISVLLGLFNSSIKGKEEIRMALDPSLVEFGSIPKIEDTEAEMLASKSNHSMLKEAFRSVRTSLSLSLATRDAKVFIISSALPGEGKTFTSFNLARAFANDNKRVLLMDLDLRKPRVHKLLASQMKETGPLKGMTNVLVDDATLTEVIYSFPQYSLDVAFAGHIPPNPSELLGTKKLQEIIEQAKASYDLVIIDSPPLLNVADTMLIAGRDELPILLVTRLFSTTQHQLRSLRDRLATVNLRLTGFLTNCVDIPKDSYGYYYGGQYYSYRSYGYYNNYAEETEKKK
jgi:capsular exopolysaccharide synthesis family protein